MTDRTYGTYKYTAPSGSARKGRWVLKMEAAIAMRAKRMFGRADSTRKGEIAFQDSTDAARDLEWFLTRYPLVAEDEASTAHLKHEADEHRRVEREIDEVIKGTRKPHIAQIAPPLKTPFWYQEQNIAMLRTRKRYILTDDVGMGKTVTGVLAINDASMLPAVIIPPTHLQSRWTDELRETVPHLSVKVAAKSTPDQDIIDGIFPDVLVVPYSKLAGWGHYLVDQVTTVIADEVHDLRGGTGTQKGAAAAMVMNSATYVMGCTATPVFNLGGEVWHVADIVSPDELGDKSEFIREWGHDTQKGIMVSDPAALGSHLREIGLFHGHSSEEVGRAMPKPHVLELNCDADPAALDAIKGDAAEMARLILDRNTHRHTRFQASGDLNAQFRQATGIAKAPFVAEYVRTLLSSHERVILFGWHREVYDIWMEALEDFQPMLYTGSENSSRKDKSKNAFITGESRVLLMSLRSGAGVDGMQKVCNQVVFGELDWSPAVHKQGIGRANRPGMDMSRPVVAHYLVSEVGSDPVVAEALGIKRQQAEPLMSRDGELLGDTTAVETGHARALATYILGAEEAARLTLPDEKLAA